MFAHVAGSSLSGHGVDPGREGHRRFAQKCAEAAGAAENVGVQIMVAAKQNPGGAVDRSDLKTELRPAPLAAPKTPPCQLSAGHVKNPIRLQPIENIIVAGHGHEALCNAGVADRLLQGEAADLSDGAIDQASELVEGHQGRVAQNGPGQVATEALAVAQYAIRLEPGGRRRQPDGGEGLHDMLDGSAGREAVDDGNVCGPIAVGIEGVGEAGPGHAGFARAAGADDGADLPVLIGGRELHVKLD
ncbi:MAG: hypothetical protein ABSG68_08670 [Thermoguttaceae bacterium]